MLLYERVCAMLIPCGLAERFFRMPSLPQGYSSPVVCLLSLSLCVCARASSGPRRICRVPRGRGGGWNWNTHW